MTRGSPPKIPTTEELLTAIDTARARQEHTVATNSTTLRDREARHEKFLADARRTIADSVIPVFDKLSSRLRGMQSSIGGGAQSINVPRLATPAVEYIVSVRALATVEFRHPLDKNDMNPHGVIFLFTDNTNAVGMYVGHRAGQRTASYSEANASPGFSIADLKSNVFVESVNLQIAMLIR